MRMLEVHDDLSAQRRGSGGRQPVHSGGGHERQQRVGRMAVEPAALLRSDTFSWAMARAVHGLHARTEKAG